MLLADALIVQADHKEAFWTEEAKALLQGIILYVATDPHEEGQRHLGRVRDLILLDGDDLKRLFELMVESPHHVVASIIFAGRNPNRLSHGHRVRRSNHNL